MPVVKQMEDTVIQHNQDMDQHKEMIRRFDEVILTKANKVAIEDIYETLKQYTMNKQFEEY